MANILWSNHDGLAVNESSLHSGSPPLLILALWNQTGILKIFDFSYFESNTLNYTNATWHREVKLPFTTYLMIQTKPTSLSKKQFFQLLIVRYVKNKWWLLALMLIFFALIASREVLDRTDFVFLMMFASYPLLIVIQFWLWVNSKENKIFLIERTYEIEEGMIIGKIDKNNFSTTEKSNIIKSDTILNTYLLYLSKNQFFYFPFDSFQSEEDRIWFENNYINGLTK